MSTAVKVAPQPASAPAGAELPYTGAEYLESIADDGREVWLNGERVRDITNHAAFRNSARMVARLYDAMHDPKKPHMRTPIEGGQGWTHPAFQAPRTLDDHYKTRDSIAEWARLTYGWMGRSPDFIGATFVTGFGVNAELFGQYAPNARRLYDAMRRKVPHYGHAIVNPPIDRHIKDQANDIMIRVEKETDAGIVVSGAKVVATGTALGQEILIAHHFIPVFDKKFSPVFTIPVNAPGIKLICRRSYEQDAAMTASPFDAPLSSRLDENDSILVFDQVLVPWENILHYEVEKTNTFMAMPGTGARSLLQGCIRLAVKMDFICGLFIKAIEIGGTRDFRGVQAAVGEAIAFRHNLWAIVEALVRDVHPWGDGFIRPDDVHGHAYRVIAGDEYSKVRASILKHVASGLIYLPSSAADFGNAEIRPLLDRFARGSHGNDAVKRAKVLKLLWDAVGSEFGSRHELYEINYAGSQEQVRVDQYVRAMKTGLGDQMVGLAETCMAEYDLDGWKAPDLVGFGG